jgi:hypothetical protein
MLSSIRAPGPHPEERALARVSKDEQQEKIVDPTLRARSRFGLTSPVFLRAFRGSDSPLDKIYLH